MGTRCCFGVSGVDCHQGHVHVEVVDLLGGPCGGVSSSLGSVG